MKGRGAVRSWCAFERRYYDECPPPWDVLYVELDEGPMFITNPAGGLSADELEEGMRVTLTFLEAEDSNGAFLLPVFEREG